MHTLRDPTNKRYISLTMNDIIKQSILPSIRNGKVSKHAKAYQDTVRVLAYVGATPTTLRLATESEQVHEYDQLYTTVLKVPREYNRSAPSPKLTPVWFSAVGI
jgi:hypothetical protein